MGFFFLILYIALSIVSPAEIFPELAPLRLTFYTGLLGVIAAAFTLLSSRRGIMRLPQVWAVIGLTAVMCLSNMIAEQWLGAPKDVFNHFGAQLTMFLL